MMRQEKSTEDMVAAKKQKRFLLSLLILTTMVAKSHQLTIAECGADYRRPEYSDISVECGTESIDLAILICPVMYSGYNDTLLVLNHLSTDECKGTLDGAATPPVVRFSFPLNSSTACGSIFQTTSSPGSGVFSDFSNIQTVNISGVVRSTDPTTGTVTYNTELKYFYSCAYPLEYLINYTQIDVSSQSVAVKDNNGSFISTLSMGLFSDATFTSPLIIPPLGIELRTEVFVEVKATNLTNQYNVLLDRCYASLSPHPANSTYFDLLFACSVDQLTTIHENGNSQHARFSFPAFRFTEQQNQTVSTYYLHCITRLCEISTCSNFLQCNSGRRRRRNVEPETENGVTQPTTLSAPITTNAETDLVSTENDAGPSNSVVGLGVTVGILSVAILVTGAFAAILFQRLRH